MLSTIGKKLFDSKGIEGLKPRRSKNRYSQNFKEKVVQEHIRKNTSFPKLAIKYDLSSAGMVVNWFRDYTIGKKTYSNRNQRNQKMKDGRKTTQIERIEIAQWLSLITTLIMRQLNISTSHTSKFIHG